MQGLLLRRRLAVAEALTFEQVAVRAVPGVRLRADLHVRVGDVLVLVRVHGVAVLDDADVRRQHAAKGDRAVRVLGPLGHLDGGLGGVAGHHPPAQRRGASPQQGSASSGKEAHVGSDLTRDAFCGSESYRRGSVEAMAASRGPEDRARLIFRPIFEAENAN